MPRRLSDQVYEQLKHLIVDGTYPPRAHLNERELTVELQVGRTPVREALQRLVRGHFLTVVPGGGYFVTDITSDGQGHVYELRSVVEVLSARLAAQRASAADVSRLRAFVARAELDPPADADGHWHLEVDCEFHILVAQATGNEYLQAAVNDLLLLTSRILFARRPRIPSVRDELDFYRLLVEAIAAHDADAAARLMADHVRDSEVENGVSIA